jgi:hypothetical protein
VITPDPAYLAERRRGFQRRGVLAAAAFALIAVSALVPQIGVEGAPISPGRSLIGASRFFLTANPNASGFHSDTASVASVGFGISMSYLGLALHQIGILTGLGSFWVLLVEDVGRWIRRLGMVSGVFLLVSAATVVLGYQLLRSAGIPSTLGIAWLPTLLAGLVMAIGAWASRRRLVSTWYWERPEIAQP